MNVMFEIFKDTKIFIIAFLTGIFTRTVLYINFVGFNNNSFVTDNWHHLYTGIIVFFISFFILRRGTLKTLLVGFSLGLIIDEICMLFGFISIENFQYFSLECFSFALVAYFMWIFALTIIQNLKASFTTFY